MILTQNSLLWLRLKNKNFSSHGASFSSIFLAFWSLEPHGPTWGVSLAGFCPGFRLVLQSPLLLLSAAEPLLCSERGGPRSKYTRRTPLFSPEENVSGQSEQPVSIFIEPRCNSLEAPRNRFPPPPSVGRGSASPWVCTRPTGFHWPHTLANMLCFPVLWPSVRKNREQRLTKVLKGRRRKSKKLERKVLHHLKMVKLKLKRYFPWIPPTDWLSVLKETAQRFSRW